MPEPEKTDTPTPPPAPKFADGALDSSKWPASKKREFNQAVRDAYDDGYAKGKDKECTAFGSLMTKSGSPNNCECRGCNGSRASQAKQEELTGVKTLAMPRE